MFETMESIRGKCSDVDHASVAGVRTLFVCTFCVGNANVLIQSRLPIYLDNGDDVVVIGKAGDDGVLLGCVYANLSSGLGGSNLASPHHWATSCLLIAAPLAVATAYLVQNSQPPADIVLTLNRGGWLVLALSATGVLVGLQVLRDSLQSRRARLLLFEAVSSEHSNGQR